MRHILADISAYWIVSGMLAVSCGQACGQAPDTLPQICPTVVPGASGAPSDRLATPSTQQPVLSTARGPVVIGQGMLPWNAHGAATNLPQPNLRSELDPRVGAGTSSDFTYPDQPSDLTAEPPPVVMPLSTALPMGLNGQPVYSMAPPTTATGVARAISARGPSAFTVRVRRAQTPPRRSYSVIRRGGCR
jgi:hypothetical protein